MPWKAANTRVTLELKEIEVAAAWQLDAAGYRKSPLPTTVSDQKNYPEFATRRNVCCVGD